VRALRRLSVDPAWEAFNFNFLEREAATAGAVRAALLTPPAMAPTRLVVARDPAELLSTRGAKRGGAASGDDASGDEEPDEDVDSGPAEEPDEGLLGSPPRAASPTEAAKLWWALLSEVPVDARLVLVISQELPATNALLKAAGQAKSGVEVIRCLEATPRTAEAWVRKLTAELGGSIDSDAAQTLVLRSGWDLTILAREIEKLLTYVGASSTGGASRIATRDVLEAATPCAETSVFDMVDHLGSRRPLPAILGLRRLIEQGEPPLRLMAMIVRQVRLVFLTREMLEAGAGVRDIEERLKLPTWVVRNYLSQARNFTRPQLVRMMRSLARLDIDIKTGRQDAGSALEFFLLHQCS